MRTIIRYGQAKKSAENPPPPPPVAPTLASSAFGQQQAATSNGNTVVGDGMQNKFQNGMRKMFEERDRGGGPGGSSTSHGSQVEVKSEPMDFEMSDDNRGGYNTVTTNAIKVRISHSIRTTYYILQVGNNSASLNESGPRDAALYPEAGQPPFKTTANTPSKSSSSSSKLMTSSPSVKSESSLKQPIKQEFELTKVKDDAAASAAGGMADIKPSFSIIPLHSSAAAAAAVTPSSVDKKPGSSGDIEIVPLLEQKGSSSSSSSHSRDIKRSLSEDDSRSKKRKRKHESSSSTRFGDGGSSDKKKYLSSSASASPDKVI